VGSCGTAAFWNRRAIVEDIQRESLWRDIKGYAAAAGVAACWSNPITSKSGQVLGALALYNSVPSAPNDYELQGLEMAAKMVGLAIERGRAEEALQRSEAAAQFQARVLSTVTEIMSSYVGQSDWEVAASGFLSSAVELTGSQSGTLCLLDSPGFVR
jgi:two-component system, sensor histidine kinase